MLRQLIYRSRASNGMNEKELKDLTDKACAANKRHNINGLLLFDGEYFFQVLEGDADAVHSLFKVIKADSRHNNVVKIMDTVTHKRDFGCWCLRTITVESGSGCYWTPPELNLHRESRVFALLNGFATGKWRTCLSDEARNALRNKVQAPSVEVSKYPSSNIQFAFQPIVDTYRGIISSIEALLRSDDGRYPEDVLNSMSPSQKYEFDLTSKAIAISQGARLLQEDQSLSINLCPGALTYMDDVSGYLFALVESNNLKPQQLVLEVTETEIIKESAPFYRAIEKIRSKGIRIAIDDFGAGYAGLSLLADFLPDKIKVDRKITTGIHENGPRQAITEAVIEFANSMGTPVVFEGVETIDEWLWLQHAGVHRFQGFLFAKPKLNGVEQLTFDAAELTAMADNRKAG
ncbi:MAG: diguanylate phosphodiesterase [Pseudomonadota bacterium]|uniref:diguanylate phosphodiesterase n=1 Tax=Alteromonas sp. S167 TaxID=3117402 RepID=UPI002EACD546|nr:diguanylate phosphodiesterase [Pseudomonadota bacterium]